MKKSIVHAASIALLLCYFVILGSPEKSLIGYFPNWAMYNSKAGVAKKFTVSGSQLVDKVKQLIHEGNIRRVRVIHEGRTILEIPLSIGAPAAAIGILAAPILAALGAFAALVTECTIEVEKVEKS